MYRRAVEDLERLISFREELAESEEEAEDAEPLATPSLLAMIPRLSPQSDRAFPSFTTPPPNIPAHRPEAHAVSA